MFCDRQINVFWKNSIWSRYSLSTIRTTTHMREKNQSSIKCSKILPKIKSPVPFMSYIIHDHPSLFISVNNQMNELWNYVHMEYSVSTWNTNKDTQIIVLIFLNFYEDSEFSNQTHCFAWLRLTQMFIIVFFWNSQFMCY